ncbi:MAG: methyltransferase domain-containing protein [Pseudomonadales bacterium]
MTETVADLAGLLACPRCDRELDDLHCPSCRIDYPLHGGVPWLFADPGAAISDWKNRWTLAAERLRADLQRTERALAANPPPRPSTRRRLQTLKAGYQAQQGYLEDLLEPLNLARGTSMETLLALRTRLPPSQGIFSYDANVYRDWCWGDAECAVARDAALQLLDGHSAQRVLVLGAGAGRLAYDLHQHSTAELTLAVDLNPLLAYVGHRVSHGATATLVEFPLAPRQPESAALERTLAAPAPTRPGLHFVLADALRVPFAGGSFDLVVTPWFLDVIDEPAEQVLRRINALLAEDGVWLNQGSVAFDGADPADRLTLEELIELAAATGFADLHAEEQCTPYMQCPDSRHGRIESVVTLRARRMAAVKPPAKHRSLPEWIVEGRAPVPALPGFQTQAMTTRMHAFIMSLIDGKRSLKDMAKVLEEQRLMPRQEAEIALRGFLAKMHEEASASGRP